MIITFAYTLELSHKVLFGDARTRGKEQALPHASDG